MNTEIDPVTHPTINWQFKLYLVGTWGYKPPTPPVPPPPPPGPHYGFYWTGIDM